jgi:hypothetical protein
MTRTRNGSYYADTFINRYDLTQQLAGLEREALFASSLQSSDDVTAAEAIAAISAAIRRLGPRGCVCQMAQEFGEHPEEARDRMRWASDVVGEITPVTA